MKESRLPICTERTKKIDTKRMRKENTKESLKRYRRGVCEERESSISWL